MTITPNKWELDVQGYLNVCNITAATPRKQIRDFSAGVNDLGLWNSMVCWPLRSSQNYGSGTTAFSLGGLGTFNGTLVNGPTWTADFVDFETSGSLMTTTLLAAASPVAFMVVNKANQDAGDNHQIFGTAGFNENGRQFMYFNTADPTTQNVLLAANTWATVSASIAAPGVSRTSRDYVSWRVLSASAVRISRNSYQSPNDETLTGWDASSPASVFEFDSIGDQAKNRLSFMSYFTAAIDNTKDAQFYSLYKSTLGTGLGLP